MSEAKTPFANGEKGMVETRDDRGRFLPGCPGGPGNPQARNVSAWRAALAGAVSAEDVVEVTEKLKAEAKKGEPWAVKELLDRVLGKPHVSVDASVSVGGEVLDSDADADARAKERFDRFMEGKGVKPALADGAQAEGEGAEA